MKKQYHVGDCTHSQLLNTSYLPRLQQRSAARLHLVRILASSTSCNQSPMRARMHRLREDKMLIKPHTWLHKRLHHNLPNTFIACSQISLVMPHTYTHHIIQTLHTLLNNLGAITPWPALQHPSLATSSLYHFPLGTCLCE